MSTLHSTERFSDRVADYVRYRPDYPAAMLDWLQREHGVTPDWKVADVGAGTGISSKLFLDAGHDSMRAWFGAGWRGTARFEHIQRLDFDGLRGRLLSSSYAPKEGHPQHEPMIAALRELFGRCQQGGRISFDYDTRIIVGTL